MTMTTEQALSLILQFMFSGQSINGDAIVRQLAKDDPILLCKLLKLQDAGSKYSKMYAAMSIGNKIEAIKQLRTVSGLGLKDAKDTIDVLMRYDYAIMEAALNLTAAFFLDEIRKDIGRDYW